jgi:YbbR domain-containing protein
VEVSIRGDPAVLEKLKLSDLAAFVNLTDVNDGVFSQKRVNVYVPTNVIPVSVVPEEVTVERVAPADPAGNHRD